MTMGYLQVTFFLTCLLLIQLVPLTADDFPKEECISGSGNYTDGSSFQADLSSLLTSFSNAQVEYGFYNSTVGEVNGIGLCWGNMPSEDCRACLTYSTQDILRLCPYYKEAILYQDICMLRYSNRPIFGRQENQPPYILYNALNVREIDSYREKQDSLLLKLQGEAASGGTLLKYAIGEAAADPYTIYGLVQCTPDLDPQDCAACVGNLSGNASEYFRYKGGGTAMAPSCYFRFEKYPFHYHLLDASPQSRLLLDASPQSPANSPQPSPFNDVEDAITEIQHGDTGKSNRKRNIVISVISAVVSVTTISCISVRIYLRRRKPKDENETNPTPEAKDEAEDKILEMESLQFNLDSIRHATDNFSDSNKLGQGGFGAVYKGTLLNGQDIAVKRLSKGSAQGELEFENEVLLVAKLQHRNLARLVGFCLEGTERLLVYEFVPNRSLDRFLFDPIRRFQLNWVRRYKIIVGIARGLLYLHEDSRLRIIHRDLKASNILLDKEMNPKISDFGIAKYFLLDQTQGDTKRIVGTYGYMPPEYAMYGNFSVKSDVYSFGVLILEIINGQKVASFNNVENVEHLTNFAWRSWREGSASNLIDPSLDAGSRNEIMRCIHIGLLCVQENPDDRPTMASIVLMLYSNSLTLPFPRRPGFFITDKMNSSCSAINSFDNASPQMSINSTSVTDLHPR